MAYRAADCNAAILAGACRGDVSEFPHLFSPLRLGPVEVRNRVVSTAHGTNLAVGHLPTERMARYHAERARGGVGLIVFEASSVHPTADFGTSVHAYDPASIPGYQRVADAVHEHGARLLVQLFHTGVNSNFRKTFRPAWGPSAVPSVIDHEVPHVMDESDMDEVVEGYAASAANVIEASLDGVEIQLGHTYLLGQFISPAYNRRDDEFGGSLENRLRFPLRVLRAVRAVLRADHVLGVRLSGEELIPGGMTASAMKEVARRVAGALAIDYVSVSVGSHPTRHMMVPPMAIPPGYQVRLAQEIKETLPSIPVSCVGRITTPALAERILAEGRADLVGMTRAQIADPRLAEKARAGRAGRIRPCIGSNQGCRGALDLGHPIMCTVNPATGAEGTSSGGPPDPTPDPKTVVVVGGGPAGLKVAEVAATRGHAVTLFEQDDELGGQVRLAARLPFREEFAGVAQHLEREVRALDVEIVLGCCVDEAAVERLAPDVVVIATGSKPLRTGVAALPLDRYRLVGSDLPHVLVPHDVLLGADVGRRVVVVDEERGYTAVGIAELLAEGGREVHLVSSSAIVGADLAATGDLPLAYPRLMANGVRIVPMVLVEEITPSAVFARHAYSGEPIDGLEAIDNVVLITGSKAHDHLYRRLKGRIGELHRIGDALAPRRVDQAIFEGDRLGRAL
jgi:mycofactocin system FadH/OYE family oxidoreductase 2